MNELNNTLQRSRRHVSFVNLWNASLCYYPEKFRPNGSVMCQFVTTSPCCSFYVYFIDYLKVIFCTFDMTWTSTFTVLMVLVLILFYSLLYMIFKYFCLPSFLSLMDMVPVSPFSYSFFYFGTCLFMPDYVSLMFNCTFVDSYAASLEFAKIIGDILHYFMIGVMALCINGYRVKAVLLWCSMAFIMMGYAYLLWVVHTKYKLFGRRDLVTSDTQMHLMNAWTFVFVFVSVLFLVMLISFYSMRKLKKRKHRQSGIQIRGSLSNFPSETDVSDKSERTSEFTTGRLWWITVNGYKNMSDCKKGVAIILTPFYFIFANIIPVMDINRPLHGWCKPVVIMSLLALPLMSIGLRPKKHMLYSVTACSWFFAFVTCISTKSLRQPSYLWLRVYSLIGMLMYSASMHALIGEIDSIIWQFMSMRFHPMPDMISIHFTSTGELLCLAVLLNDLIDRDMLDAAFGAIVSVITHCIYLALPELVIQECYSADIYILCTSKVYTTTIFFIVIFFCTLLHVTMSGNEFRMSLFFYLVAMYTSYMLFQTMVYHKVIHPFGQSHHIRPPSDMRDAWA